MKKGLSTQIFIFIFALIMIALVLGFGIKTLGTVRSTADNVELLTFVDNVNDVVQEYYSFDVGSNKQIQLLLPQQVTHVCFSNPNQPITAANIPRNLAFLMEENKQDNLYILPLDTFKNPAPDFTIPHMKVPDAQNPTCIQTNGRFTAVLETVLYNDQIFVQVS